MGRSGCSSGTKVSSEIFSSEICSAVDSRLPSSDAHLPRRRLRHVVDNRGAIAQCLCQHPVRRPRARSCRPGQMQRAQPGDVAEGARDDLRPYLLPMPRIQVLAERFAPGPHRRPRRPRSAPHGARSRPTTRAPGQVAAPPRPDRRPSPVARIGRARTHGRPRRRTRRTCPDESARRTPHTAPSSGSGSPR
jgi:hypothetical protein